MAKLLTNGTDLTNYTEYPNTFRRQGAFPLDAYSLFKSYNEAQAYASRENGYAYIGQTLVVADGKDVKQYIIVDTKGTLQLAGGGSTKEYNIPETQEIVFSNGVSKIKLNFDLILNVTTPQKLKIEFYNSTEQELTLETTEDYTDLNGEIEIVLQNNKSIITHRYGNQYVFHRENGFSITDTTISKIKINNTNITGTIIVEETFSN